MRSMKNSLQARGSPPVPRSEDMEDVSRMKKACDAITTAEGNAIARGIAFATMAVVGCAVLLPAAGVPGWLLDRLSPLLGWAVLSAVLLAGGISSFCLSALAGTWVFERFRKGRLFTELHRIECRRGSERFERLFQELRKLNPDIAGIMADYELAWKRKTRRACAGCGDRLPLRELALCGNDGCTACFCGWCRLSCVQKGGCAVCSPGMPA
ncbi:MAG: hypothetical protein HY520_01875 [Candidatus Aenigmarchaeota archaeon]|nr:hypothetical protein [Candidatus Aenigmarchaeota archaeon]